MSPTTQTNRTGRPEAALWRFFTASFTASVFFIPVSLPAARSCLAASLLGLIVACLRTRRRPEIPATFWLAVAFAAAASLATIFGVDPARGFAKLDKLVWFAGIGVAANAVATRAMARRVLVAFALGSLVKAVQLSATRPFAAARTIAEGVTDDWSFALAHGVSMTDGQRLMLGLLAVVGLLIWDCRKRGSGRSLWWWPTVAIAMGLLMTFKRGSWFCAALAVVVIATLSTKRRYVAIPLFIIALTLSLPLVQARLADLSSDLAWDSGGRTTMWFTIAPELIEQHPMGVGYRSLTNEMMHEIAPNVEPKRNHLHSNIAQTLVATGWLGLTLYLVWMTRALIDAFRYRRRALAMGDDEESLYALVFSMMLVGLLLNGLIEYNLGDAEIVLAYGLVLGACSAGARRCETGAS